jgi:hypothetical protein
MEMNAKGDTAFVWEHAGSNLEMRASMRPAGGTFSNPPLELSDDGAVRAVAIDAAGDVFLAWRDYRGAPTARAGCGCRPGAGVAERAHARDHDERVAGRAVQAGTERVEHAPVVDGRRGQPLTHWGVGTGRNVARSA